MSPLYFLLMVAEPPSSPLFPYTTLFRSRVVGQGRSGCGAIGATLPDTAGSARRRASQRRNHGERFLDRKSTRLNSSHGSISYAVFCLKKKKRGLRDQGARRGDLLAASPF